MPFSATRDLWLVLKARDEGTRAMKSFSRDIRQVGDTVRTANLYAARSALVNHAAMQRLGGAMVEDLLLTQRQIAAVDRQIGQQKIHRAQMEENRVSAQRLSMAMSGVAASSAAMGTALIAGSAFGIIGMKGLVDSAIEYQKQSSLTRTQVDKFSLSLRDIEDIGLRVAKTIGVPFEEIQPALFDIFSSMEVGAKQAEQLLGTFAKAAVAGQTSIQSASRSTIGILNAFQLPLSSVNHLMDLQFQLVQEGVGSYDEWAQRIGLVSPSAARAGQSVETMLAALAVTTRMGISAARSGTAVARAFDAMSNPKTVNALKKLGVNALDAKGNFRPLIDVLFEFRREIMKLPKGERIAKILDIFKGAGGTIEARRFLQNMLLTPGNLELFKSIFDEMSTESGSFEQAYSIMADTAATKSELLANKWKTVKVAAGEALIPTFIKIVEWLGKVFDKFNELSPETKKFLLLLAGGGLVFGGFMGILLLVISVVAAFATAVAVVGPVLLVVAAAVLVLGAGLSGLIGIFALLWLKSETFRESIKKTFEKLKRFYDDYIHPTFEKIKTSFEKTILPALAELRKTFDEKVMPAITRFWNFLMTRVKPAVIEIGNTIKDFLIVSYEKLANIIQTKVIPIIDECTRFYNDHKKSIDLIVAVIVTLIKWMLKFVAILGGVVVMFILGPVMDAFMGFITLIVLLVEWFVELGEWLNEVRKWFEDLVDSADETTKKMKKLGRQLIFGFIDGLLESKNELITTIEGLGSAIVNKFKSKLGIASPSKVFREIGRNSAKGFMLGFTGAADTIRASVTNTTAGLANAASSGANSGGRSINQSITINTQEINPRRQSAELGWLLAGSM